MCYNCRVSSIECIPNVSEGRRRDVVATFAAAIRAVPRVRLLDQSADADHHRSVFTMAGDATALKAAVLELFAAAIPAIDLRRHRGAHPRIGAVDVVPFVPLGDTPLATCAALARDVGRVVADRFGVPVYLYEAAATNADRRRLEDVRRGQFEGLDQRMGQHAGQPDFGPARPHPTAGASAVGARGPLIAWNVDLATPDHDAAREIARQVRESSGGLPCVKALGVWLADRRVAQVSMNLTDYRTTSLATVMARIRAEAARLGVGIAGSELIGLIPEAALEAVDIDELGLPRFPDDQILERRLES
jgi:glutamate formiminotransferase|tara:strand:- start:184 stop:1095 length:912 start_codon:yes stop_codon:yes gene_type:complete